MRVLLIDPGFGEKSFGTFGKSHWSSIIHHGLCCISAYAKSKGFEIELADLRKIKGWEDFKKEVAARRPAVVGIAMRSWDLIVASKVIDIIRRVDPSIRIVVGGIHPTVALNEVEEDERIDYIITGEGEVSFANLLESINNNKAVQRIIKGISPDLDSLPFDDRELYDYNTVIKIPNYPGIFDAPMVTIMTSRGCRYNCNFCQPHARMMFGKGIRLRSVDNVVEELDILRKKYDFKSLKAYDSNFTIDSNWVREFCEKYRSNGFSQPFLCQTRADLICKDEEAIKKLSKAGLRLMIIGFESGSQRILNFLRKGTTVKQNIEAAEICRKYGVRIVGNFMLGVPTETKEEVMETVEMVKKMRPDFTSVSFFTPIPGCYLYEYCKENDLSLVTSSDDYITFSPEKPKIKGVDYDFLRKAANEIMGVKFGGKAVGRLIRYFYTKTKNQLRLRQFLVRCYSYWINSRKCKANDQDNIS